MKKLVLVLLSAMTTFQCFSQTDPVVEKVKTTDEEYNYLTQGYKISLENGTDIKSGYSFKHLPEVISGDFSAQYSFFIDENKKTKAVLIVMKKIKKNDDKAVYLCLPFNNSELLAKFYLDTLSLGLSMKPIFDITSLAMLANVTDKIRNR